MQLENLRRAFKSSHFHRSIRPVRSDEECRGGFMLVYRRPIVYLTCVLRNGTGLALPPQSIKQKTLQLSLCPLCAAAATSEKTWMGCAATPWTCLQPFDCQHYYPIRVEGRLWSWLFLAGPLELVPFKYLTLLNCSHSNTPSKGRSWWKERKLKRGPG